MIKRIRAFRLALAASSVLLVMLVSLVAVVLNALSKAETREPTQSFLQRALSSPWTLAALFIIIALAIAAFQTWERHRRLTYDPTWALAYQRMFGAMDEDGRRKDAAKTLRNHRGDLSRIEEMREELSPIDEVLDFLEDIGFYVKGAQISPEAAHHHFYHWIRGYYQSSRAYIDKYQEKEPARWENLGFLFGITTEVEREVEKRIERKTGRRVGPQEEDLDAFLREEIGDDPAGEEGVWTVATFEGRVSPSGAVGLFHVPAGSTAEALEAARREIAPAKARKAVDK